MRQLLFLKLLFLVTSVSVSVSASELKIKGLWKQGAMLIGQTEPGSQIRVLDRDVKVAADGRFVFGLGRDAAGEVVLERTSPTGEKTVHRFPVEQRSYATQRIDGVEKKYVSPPPEVSARIKREAARVWKSRQGDSDLRFFEQSFIWPAKGRITGVYGSQRVFNGVPKRPHYGLDIAGPVGAEVVAPASGKVILVHNDMYYSGGTLIVDHGHGISSTYIHLHKIHVEEGQMVTAGELIAEIGATGRVTGPHLDWRINWFDQRLDPQLLLPARTKAQ